MPPTHAAMRRLGTVLKEGERLVWADQPRHGLLRRVGLPPRTPGALLASSLLLAAGACVIGLTLARAVEPDRALLVLGLALAVVVTAVVLAWRRPARALYAATDRGRGLVLEGGAGCTLSFALPTRIVVAASRDLELGDLDLGVLDVEVHEAPRPPRQERRPVRLRAVAYPRVVADLLQGLVPLPERRSSDRFDHA